MLLVHNALDAITKQIQKLGLSVGNDAEASSINYTLFHFIDEKHFSNLEYEAVLDEVFGRNTTVEHLSSNFNDKLNAVTLKYHLNNMNIRLEIHTISTRSIDEARLDHGRLDYKSDKWLTVQSRLIPSEN